MTATNIKSYSSTAASNNSSPPNGAPEGMAPSTVNDCIRQVMAEIRRWYVDPLWIDLGYTYAYVSTTSFKVAGSDVTANYPVGARVRAVGVTTGTIYGTIATSAFSTDSTMTVTWDSGTLASETLAISVGPPSLGKPIGSTLLSGVGQLPVGSLYFNAAVATNPATLLGYGTWTAYAAGRTIMGVGTGTDSNAATLVVALGDTLGEYSHALTSAELAAHTHDGSSLTAASGGAHTHTATTSNLVSSGTVMVATVQGGTVGSWTSDSGGAHTHTVSGTTGSTGSGTAHNVTNPYIGCYVWKRTA